MFGEKEINDNMFAKYLPTQYEKLDKLTLQKKILDIKTQLGKNLLILGHHYQLDEIIEFADKTGDSFELSKEAAKSEAKYILFCGVRFMAETADLLSKNEQRVFLPNDNAGCFMADLADREDVVHAWEQLTSIAGENIVPITYINSDASLKAFCGLNGGAVCTSSNAEKILKWALTQKDKVMFFPDQHLGRNTAFFKLGISLDDMIVWRPQAPLGGNTEDQIKKAKIILWYGYCNVHEKFSSDYVDQIKNNSPETKIIVHPECTLDVVIKADYVGSTSYIIKTIENAHDGTKWAIGTEKNLVNRLKNKYPYKNISILDKEDIGCRAMSLTSLPYLLFILENIVSNNYINTVKVEDVYRKPALLSLQRMLDLSK